MTPRSYFRAAIAAVVFSAACGGDGPTTPPIELTEDQAADMMEAFSLIAAYGLGGGTGQIIINRSIDASGPCPNGGTYSVDGTESTNTETGTVTGSIVQDFTACKATSDAGRLWTFDGDPNVTTTFSFTYNQTTETATYTLTQTGAFKAASDLGNGRCAINLTMTLNFGVDSFTGSADGSICGHDMQVDLSAEPGVGNLLRKMTR